MPYKYAEDGSLVTQDVNGKHFPVFVNPKGEESPLDADSTIGTISRLNGEAMGHRKRAEDAEKLAKQFEGLDPQKAREAFDTLSKIDQKKLIDAGKVDEVTGALKDGYEVKLSEQAKGFQTQIHERDEKFKALESELFNEKIGGAVARSKFVAEKMAIPPDMVLARFGSSFKVEDGKVVAYDQHGNKLYSSARPGELANVEEALPMLIDAYPYKDQILRGSGANGGGADPKGGAGGGGGGGRTIKRAMFDASSPNEQGKIAREVREGKIKIVD